MFNLRINTVDVVFTKPFQGLDEETIKLLTERHPRQVVFIDTPPMPGLLKAIEQVRTGISGVSIILRDHHDIPDPKSPRDQEIHGVAETVRAQLGAAATISDRKTNPACSSLIRLGEFSDRNSLIIADNDPDGLTAAMKACGVVYPDLDYDAAILDGPRAAQNRENGLSEVAELFVKAMSSLPPFDGKNPTPSEKAKAALFSDFIEATQGHAEAKNRLASRTEVYEKAVAVAQHLLEAAIEITPGVWFVDVSAAASFDLTTLASGLEARKGCRITVLLKAQGPIAAKHGGKQYSLARAKGAGEELDLRRYLPAGFVSSPESGIIANTPFLLHVSEGIWNAEVLPRLTKEHP